MALAAEISSRDHQCRQLCHECRILSDLRTIQVEHHNVLGLQIGPLARLGDPVYCQTSSRPCRVRIAAPGPTYFHRAHFEFSSFTVKRPETGEFEIGFARKRYKRIFQNLLESQAWLPNIPESNFSANLLEPIFLCQVFAVASCQMAFLSFSLLNSLFNFKTD